MPEKHDDGQHEQPAGVRVSTLKINNNSLVSLEALPGALVRILWRPAELTWIDASFNHLADIDDVCALDVAGSLHHNCTYDVLVLCFVVATVFWFLCRDHVLL